LKNGQKNNFAAFWQQEPPLSKGVKGLLFLPRYSNQKALATLKNKENRIRLTIKMTMHRLLAAQRHSMSFLSFASSRFSDYFSRWRIKTRFSCKIFIVYKN